MATLKALGIIVLIGLFGGLIFLRATPTGREAWNNWQESLKEVDETTYENQKMVEDNARLQIVAYEAALNEYDNLKLQCGNTQDNLTCERASAKFTSVNNLAIKFNEYMLLNSHIWAENIPSDIDRELMLLVLE